MNESNNDGAANLLEDDLSSSNDSSTIQAIKRHTTETLQNQMKKVKTSASNDLNLLGMDYSTNLSTAGVSHQAIESEQSYLPRFIYRDDKELIPLNFVNNFLNSWDKFQLIKTNSITRVGQGFSIRCLYPANLSIPEPFEVNSIKYICKQPSKVENFQGEISIILSDQSDFELLKLSDSQIQEFLEIPGSQATNSIISVKTVFPKRSNNDYSSGTIPRLIKCIIAFTNEIPEYLVFQSLVTRVSKYTPPPTRCYRCQRYGHGSLTCRRAEFCSKCGKKGHSNQKCSSPDWKCASCGGNHGAASPKCKFLSLAAAVLEKINTGT